MARLPSYASLAAAMLLAPTFAGAQTLGPLVKISSGTPFKGCTADQVSSQPGTNFGGSAIEPWIAVDPTTAGHLLTAVQQDRWSNGGSRGLRAGVSVDGGTTWSNNIPQGISLCTGGPFQRSTDPWSAFGLDGVAYFFSLAFNNNPVPAINGASAMLVSRSTDGGNTWGNPIALIDDTDPLAFNDKNSLTTDPYIAGNVYAVWDRLYGPPTAFRAPGGSDEHPNAMAANDGVAMARSHAAALREAAATGAAITDTFGPTYFARSLDSGQTWSRASPIYDPGRGAQTINNLIVGLPSGELFDFFTLINNQGQAFIAYVSSLDHGFSWSRTATIVSPLSLIAAVTPNTQQPIRDSSLLFSVSVDQTSGRIYLLREDVVGNSTIVGAVFMQSSDSGKTWSTPVTVSQTPANADPLRQQAFNVTVVAAQNGTLVATYYDFRNDRGAAGKELTDAWVLFCNPGTTGTDCIDPANWTNEQRLTNGSFNLLNAPLTDSGYFLGDYFGLVGQGMDVWPAFTTTTGVGHTALFTRRITLSAATAAAQ